MSARAEVAQLWEEVIRDFLAGATPDELPEPLDGWFRSYAGRGQGRVEPEAMPEPYGGSLLAGKAAIVFLDLNPGRADLAFQGRDGLWANHIEELGSYDAFAASQPYLSQAWVEAKGKNRHQSLRLEFMRRWHKGELEPEHYQSFELYPWHSTKLTAPIRADPEIIRRFIWEPIAELGNPPAFAFGADWFPQLLNHSGLMLVERLGKNGRDFGSTVPSREVLVFRTPTGGLVIAEKHMGSAAPPREDETQRLREAVERVID